MHFSGQGTPPKQVDTNSNVTRLVDESSSKIHLIGSFEFQVGKQLIFT